MYRGTLYICFLFVGFPRDAIRKVIDGERQARARWKTAASGFVCQRANWNHRTTRLYDFQRTQIELGELMIFVWYYYVVLLSFDLLLPAVAILICTGSRDLLSVISSYLSLTYVGSR